MDRYCIVIEMGNDAFLEGESLELARLLRDLAEKLDNDPNDAWIGDLFDLNGNKVGSAGWAD